MKQTSEFASIGKVHPVEEPAGINRHSPLGHAELAGPVELFKPKPDTIRSLVAACTDLVVKVRS